MKTGTRTHSFIEFVKVTVPLPEFLFLASGAKIVSGRARHDDFCILIAKVVIVFPATSDFGYLDEHWVRTRLERRARVYIPNESRFVVADAFCNVQRNVLFTFASFFSLLLG